MQKSHSSSQQNLEQPRRAPKLQSLQSREFSISFDETVQNFVGEMGPGQVVSRQTLAITTISINIPIVMPRVVYDRVRNRKNYFEIPAFLPIEQGISKVGKFRV